MTKKKNDNKIFIYCLMIGFVVVGFYKLCVDYQYIAIGVIAFITVAIILFAFRKLRNRKKKKIANQTTPLSLKQEVYFRARYRCEVPKCNYNKSLEIHHIDENHNHNEYINLLVVCPNHHTRIHNENWSQSTQCSWIFKKKKH